MRMLLYSQPVRSKVAGTCCALDNLVSRIRIMILVVLSQIAAPRRRERALPSSTVLTRSNEKNFFFISSIISLIFFFFYFSSSLNRCILKVPILSTILCNGPFPLLPFLLPYKCWAFFHRFSRAFFFFFSFFSFLLSSVQDEVIIRVLLCGSIRA